MPRKGEKQQFCINKHDTFICGRDKGGACILCRKRQKINHNRLYYYDNRKILLDSKKKYYELNKEKIIKKKIIYEAKRISIDPLFSLTRKLRKRLMCALKGNYKSGSAVRDLDCSIEFLKQYIESKFYSNMTWSNWGTVWELDHITSLWKFDLANREQFLKAVNYTNLQPLMIEDHRKKTDRETIERTKLKQEFK